MNKTSWCWIAALAAIILAGYACFRYYTQKSGDRKIKREPDRKVEHDKVQPQAASMQETMNMEETPKEETPSLSPILKYFKGQCNSFRIVAEKPRSPENCEKIFDYADNVIQYHADNSLKEWWKGFAGDRTQWDLALYQKKAGRMLYMLCASGVVPSTERIITWNEDASKHYMPFDDIETGDVCHVIQPYWIYQHEIFEQGLVSKKMN